VIDDSPGDDGAIRFNGNDLKSFEPGRTLLINQTSNANLHALHITPDQSFFIHCELSAAGLSSPAEGDPGVNSRSDKPEHAGAGDGLAAVMDAQLFVDMAQVGFNGIGGEVKRLGYFGICHLLIQQTQDL
jgi:hypothetical protein